MAGVFVYLGNLHSYTVFPVSTLIDLLLECDKPWSGWWWNRFRCFRLIFYQILSNFDFLCLLRLLAWQFDLHLFSNLLYQLLGKLIDGQVNFFSWSGLFYLFFLLAATRFDCFVYSWFLNRSVIIFDYKRRHRVWYWIGKLWVYWRLEKLN